MSASSSATRTRCGVASSVVEPVMDAIVAVPGQVSDLGGSLYGGKPRHAPSYPNWQRNWIQKPAGDIAPQKTSTGEKGILGVAEPRRRTQIVRTSQPT